MDRKDKQKRPPKRAERLLKYLIPDEGMETPLGDFEEFYTALKKRKGRLRAWLWYWGQIFILFRQKVGYGLFWGLDMARSYLKISFRLFRRQKLYAFINLSGLVVGLACCLVILIYVRSEMSFDQYHQDKDLVFRVTSEIESQAGKTRYAVNVPPLAPALNEEIPEVEEAARIGGFYFIQVIQRGDSAFYEKGFVYADPEVFSILTMTFLEGNPETAIRGPDTVVIPKRLARKYFPGEKALGKILRIGKRECVVTGVIEDAPQNSHLPYDIFRPWEDLPHREDDWSWPGVLTYVKLAAGADSGLFLGKIRHFGADRYKNHPDTKGTTISHSLQPVTSIYLFSTGLEGDICRHGNVSSLYVFSVVGLVILIISCFNFINLSTAGAVKRAREVGVRKVVGANRKALIGQFLTESHVTAFFALALSLVIVAAGLPVLRSLLDTSLELDVLRHPGILLTILALTFCVAVFAGSYPAFFLSSLRPEITLKGKRLGIPSGLSLRKILVVAQFTASVALIIGTIIIFNQLNFMRSKNLGFRKEEKLVITVKGTVAYDLVWEDLKNGFTKDPGITGAAASCNFPGEGLKMMLREKTKIRGEFDFSSRLMYYYFCDSDFFDVYGMELATGENFNRFKWLDSLFSCLINEAAVSAFGWMEPRDAIGKQIRTSRGIAKNIIGVVMDFHFQGVQHKIEPLILENDPGMFENLTLSLSTANLENTLDNIKTTWKNRFPGSPLQYVFLDSVFAEFYRGEERMGRLASIFTTLGVFIACLGLLGLVTLSAEQRTKEIGIRKVLGASLSDITGLLSRQFIGWVVAANLIAWPVAYFAMYFWLRGFAYRAAPKLWVYIMATVISFLLTIFTIGLKSVKTAASDPVDSLRYE
ncbi:ABC transporter permease [Acidobacteriota bacterium]